jgi:hypothetical protein
MRILHVVSTVGTSAPNELQEAQRITLESLELAQRCAVGIDVRVAASRYADEPLPAEWLMDFPCLQTSASELWNVPDGPRLPLLREVLMPLQCDIPYDFAVYTNIDIGVQPFFYQLVRQWAESGLDAVNVTRRNVDADLISAGLPAIQAALGTRHPGSDCFAFISRIAKVLHVGDVCLGLPPVGRTMALALWLNANNYRKFGNQHATFHIGSDPDWKTNPIKQIMSKRNADTYQAVLHQLSEKHGVELIKNGNIECFENAQNLNKSDHQ